MFCSKCGKENPDSAVYCAKCGEKIGMVATKPPIYKEKKLFSDQLFWWRMSGEEVQKQIGDYDSLKIYQSYRGISSLLLIFSAILTIIIFVFLDQFYWAIFDVLVFLFLAIFVQKGKKWAIIGAMIFWTYEKVAYYLLTGEDFFIQIIWWVIYEAVFYKALRVEQIREKELSKNVL